MVSEDDVVVSDDDVVVRVVCVNVIVFRVMVDMVKRINIVVNHDQCDTKSPVRKK